MRTIGAALTMVAVACSSDGEPATEGQTEANAQTEATTGPPPPTSSASSDESSTGTAGATDPSVGCGAPLGLRVGETEARSLTFDGLDRTYGVRVPAGYAGEPAPVVFVLHGGFGSGAQIETSQAEMNPFAEEAGAILIYPDGVATFPQQPPGPGQTRVWNAGTCCGPSVARDVDDVGFLLSALDDVENSACVDRNRVFATGMSNGAMMSYRFACEAADRIAAIAPVAATRVFDPCSPSRPVPLLHIHGDLDLNVPYDGGEGCGASGVETPSVEATVTGWSEINGCAATRSPGLVEGNGVCVEFDGCARATVLCTIEGGNHSWPGGVPMAGTLPECEGPGTQSQSFMASPAIWDFFAANPRN